MGELAVCAYAVDIRGADTHAGEAGASWLLMDLVPAQAQRPPLTPQTPASPPPSPLLSATRQRPSRPPRQCQRLQQRQQDLRVQQPTCRPS